MDLSAIQPEAASAQSGIFAMFLPANADVDSAPASLFGNLLQDALRLAGGTPPAAADGVPESSTQIAGGPANLVVAQLKGEGHKKQESKSASGGSTGTLTPFMLTLGSVPMEPLQKLDQATFANAASVPETQSHQVSEALVPGTSVAKVPSLGTSFRGVTGKETQPSVRPQSDASAATKARLTGGFSALPSSEILPGGPASISEVQDIGSIAPELADGKLAQKIGGHSEKTDEQEFKTHAQSIAPCGNAQIQPENFAPVAKQLTSKTSEPLQLKEGQKPVANATERSALTITTTTSSPSSQPSQPSNAPLATTPFLPSQGGLNLPFTTNSSVNDDSSVVMDVVVSSAPENGAGPLHRDSAPPASLNPTSNVLPVMPMPMGTSQSEENEQGVQAPAVASPKVQPQFQIQPQSQSQAQPQPQPAMHYQHRADQGGQVVSGLMQAKNPGNLLKSTATNISTQVSATHHSVANTQENRPLTRTDTPATASNPASANPTASRGADRKVNQADQTNSAPQSAQAATATPPPVQAVMPAAINAPAPPAGVPAAASQPVVASPSQTPAVKLAAHDLPAAVPDPSAPVQVHAARMIQSDVRSEMRLDMQTQAFGGVEVHTSVSGKDVQLSVSAEHGDLRSFLAPEMPVLQSNLQQHDLRLQQVRTVFNTGTQREFSSGSGQQEQRFTRPHPRPGMFDQHDIAGSPEEEDSPKGLSIRI